MGKAVKWVAVLQNGVDPNNSVEGLVIKHEVWTWELLHILFSHISDGSKGHQADSAGGDDSMDAMEPEADPSEV